MTEPAHHIVKVRVLSRYMLSVLKHPSQWFTWASLLVLVCTGVEICPAGGVLHVFPPSVQNETFAIARQAVLVSRTIVTVTDSHIEYRIDQTFHNNNDFPLTGLFILPVSRGEQPEDLEIRVDGVICPTEVMSPEAFHPLLKELTLSMKDPSLMGLAGRTVAVIRPIHMGIRGQKTFRCQFKIPVSMESDGLDLTVPLDGEQYSIGVVGELDVRVRIKSSHPVRSLFSSSHAIAITRESPYRCMAATKVADKVVREPFHLIATFSDADPEFRVFTHRDIGKRGFFMALIPPPIAPSTDRQPEKDVVFLIDASRSMGTADLASAKQAVVSGVERLRSGDRFNVIVVDTRPRMLFEKLVPLSEHNAARAVGLVNALQRGGATDLYNSVIGALEQFSSRKRPGFVVFAGNGHGTVGITNPETILEHIQKNNRFRARFFTLGLGMHKDVAFLERIAAFTKGASFNDQGKEDFESLLNRVFSTVSPPRMSEIQLELPDISPEEVDPDPIPDLIGEENIVLLGRYSTKGDVSSKIKLKAKVQGRIKTVSKAVVFPETSARNTFLPGLWAMRRIGGLLQKERIRGTEYEMRDQLSGLAKEFGFRLPAPGGPVQKELNELLWKFKTSYTQTDLLASGYKIVRGRVFRLSPEGAWIDSNYQSSMTLRTVKFLSDDYFDLVRQSPDIGPFLVIGPDCILVRGKEALHIKSSGTPNAS
jgi:Ca-activated chloride channel family protein